MGMDTVSESGIEWSRSREEFLSQVNVCIQQDHLMKVHDAICNNEIDRTVLEASCMDLVSSLTNHIADKINFNVDEASQCCDVFHSLAKVCNAKEMVLAFCEQIEAVSDNRIFYILLDPLSTALDHVHPPTPKILEQSLDTIYGYLIAEPLPRHLDTKSKKRLKEIDSFTQLLTKCVDFVKHFVDIYTTRLSRMENSIVRKSSDERILLQNCCLGILANPLVNLDLKLISSGDEFPTKSAKNSWRNSADKLMKMLHDVQCNYMEVLKFGQKLITSSHTEKYNRRSPSYQQRKRGARTSTTTHTNTADRMNDSDSETESSYCGSSADESSINQHETYKKQEEDLGRACLAYLLFSEHLHDDNIPQIYSPVHVFSSTLYFINLLLTDVNTSLIQKGVYLGLSLLIKLPEQSIQHDTLELHAYREFPELIINTMLRCPDKELRTQSLQVLTMFISKLEAMGRYKLLRLLIAKCKHAGVIGMLIGKIKDEIHTALNFASNNPPVANTHSMFLGFSVHSLLVQIFKLPKASETDILEESDRIMAALNLLRYLLIRDTKNKTLVALLMPKCEAGFLTHLRNGLNMSRVHYKLEIEKVTKKIRLCRTSTDQKNIEMNGENVDPTSLKQQFIMLQNALHMFDMIQSIMGRISELS